MNTAVDLNHDELDQTMVSIIQRIATGPDLSKDIDFDEARLGMLDYSKMLWILFVRRSF